MPVNLVAPVGQSLFPVAGLRIGIAQAGVRKAGRKDLCVMLLDDGAHVAGVFTQNQFCAAPVQISREHLSTGVGIRAILINTGNANAGTGRDGLERARVSCRELAQRIGVSSEQILPFSTGVIMEPLPVERVVAHLDDAISDAKEDNWLNAAQAIMTTDTLPKAASCKVSISGHVVTVTGISKGAGMIRPNMATMLGYVATDACIASDVLQAMVQPVADGSFNRITVDGDTSTNDSFVLIATNKAGNACITAVDSREAQILRQAVLDVAKQLAHAIVRDGEGATKFIAIKVEEGRNAEECLKVAYAIAHSPLVKTAFFASDPNLGRILAAVGYSGVEDLDQTCIDLYLDDVHVAAAGGRNPTYQEEDGQRVMMKSEISIRVVLGRGRVSETVWTCDLSHEYVTINADYRS